MDAEDFLSPVHIGKGNGDLTVKTAGAQQRRVENVGAVGGCDDDHTFLGVEAVHFHKELVERLLALVVSAAHAVAAVTSDGIDLIDENQAGRVLFPLFEHVAHAGCTYTDEHLHEIRSGDREERHIRLAGDRAGEKGFSRSRRADHQHALGDGAAEFLEFLGIAEEIYDLEQLFLRLLDASHVLEGDLVAIHREQARLGFPERHRAATGGFHLLAEKEEQQ